MSNQVKYVVELVWLMINNMEKEIKIPIYGGKIIFIYGELSHVKDKYNLNFNPNDYDAVVFDVEEKDQFILAFSVIKESTLMHEIIHLVNNIFKSRNIKLDIDNDEPQAYLGGWIADELYTFIKESINK